jgi:hypothetical protein
VHYLEVRDSYNQLEEAMAKRKMQKFLLSASEIIGKEKKYVEVEMTAHTDFCVECMRVFQHSEFYSHHTGMDREKLGQHDGHRFISCNGTNAEGTFQFSTLIVGSDHDQV